MPRVTKGGMEERVRRGVADRVDTCHPLGRGRA